MRAATGLFLERGLAATSVSDIAAAAGVSRRTFFLYFPAKEDVLFHHIEGHVRTALDALTPLGPEATAWDGVQTVVAALVHAFDTTADHADELADVRAQLFRDADGLPGSLMLRLRSVYATLLTALRERFPDSADQPLLSAHLGAVMGAVAAAATSVGANERAATMRSALERAGAGFRRT